MSFHSNSYSESEYSNSSYDSDESSLTFSKPFEEKYAGDNGDRRRNNNHSTEDPSYLRSNYETRSRENNRYEDARSATYVGRDGFVDEYEVDEYEVDDLRYSFNSKSEPPKMLKYVENDDDQPKPFSESRQQPSSISKPAHNHVHNEDEEHLHASRKSMQEYNDVGDDLYGDLEQSSRRSLVGESILNSPKTSRSNEKSRKQMKKKNGGDDAFFFKYLTILVGIIVILVLVASIAVVAVMNNQVNDDKSSLDSSNAQTPIVPTLSPIIFVSEAPTESPINAVPTMGEFNIFCSKPQVYGYNILTYKISFL